MRIDKSSVDVMYDRLSDSDSDRFDELYISSFITSSEIDARAADFTLQSLRCRYADGVRNQKERGRMYRSTVSRHLHPELERRNHQRCEYRRIWRSNNRVAIDFRSYRSIGHRYPEYILQTSSESRELFEIKWRGYDFRFVFPTDN